MAKIILILTTLLLVAEILTVSENKQRINSLRAANTNRIIVVSKGKARVVLECQSRTKKALKKLGVRCPRKEKQ